MDQKWIMYNIHGNLLNSNLKTLIYLHFKREISNCSLKPTRTRIDRRRAMGEGLSQSNRVTRRGREPRRLGSSAWRSSPSGLEVNRCHGGGRASRPAPRILRSLLSLCSLPASSLRTRARAERTQRTTRLNSDLLKYFYRFALLNISFSPCDLQNRIFKKKIYYQNIYQLD